MLTAIILAQYLTLLDWLTIHYGEIEGKKYFDKLFGSAEECTPVARRLTLSKYGHAGTKLFCTGYLLNAPLNPLTFFTSPAPCAFNNFLKIKNIFWQVQMEPGTAVYIR